MKLVSDFYDSLTTNMLQLQYGTTFDYNKYCNNTRYHLYNLKNVKSTHGGLFMLVKLQASTCNFTKISTPPWVFLCFLNCTNGAKSRNAPHILLREENFLAQTAFFFFEIPVDTGRTLNVHETFRRRPGSHQKHRIVKEGSPVKHRIVNNLD